MSASGEVERFGGFGERSTQIDLADALEVARPTVSQWKHGIPRGFWKYFLRFGYSERQARALERWTRGEGDRRERPEPDLPQPAPAEAADKPPAEVKAETVTLDRSTFRMLRVAIEGAISAKDWAAVSGIRDLLNRADPSTGYTVAA